MRSQLFVWTLFTSCIAGKGVGGNGAVINSRRVPLATNRFPVSRVETTTSYGDENAALKVEVEIVYDEKSALKVEVENVSDEDCETESAYYDLEKKRDIRLQKRAKRSREEKVQVAFKKIWCRNRIGKKGTAHTFNRGVGRERC